ncbi:hypothetical protein ACFWA5_07910 [Streptomyces mirabilis]|uniref:hypothetical protein n=1 Tax=Streptomyces mirabilis TaxID=68239 RepID=UPI003668F98C
MPAEARARSAPATSSATVSTAAIGRRLGKSVLMDPEGDYGHPVLGFDVEADRVILLAEPGLSVVTFLGDLLVAVGL